MKPVLIITGILILIVIMAFLNFLIAGADESRRMIDNKDRQDKDK